MMRTYNWCVYLSYNKILYTSTWHFPYEHLAKYGKVKLFDNYASGIHGGVVVKPRNIYFIPIPLTSNQIISLVIILNKLDWIKQSLCDIDINSYPEIFI